MRPPAPQVRRLQATPHTHFFRKGGGTLNMASLCTVKPYKTPTHPPPPTHGSCPFPPQTLHQRRILRAVRREGMCAEELRYADNSSIASLCATAGRPLSSTPRTPPDVLAPPPLLRIPLRFEVCFFSLGDLLWERAREVHSRPQRRWWRARTLWWVWQREADPGIRAAFRGSSCGTPPWVRRRPPRCSRSHNARSTTRSRTAGL